MASVNLPPDLGLLNIPRKSYISQPSLSKKILEKPIFVEVNANEPGNVEKIKNGVPEVENEPKVLGKEINEEKLEESIPYHERTITTPMPFFPMDIHVLGMDEFRNEGSITIDFLRQRAIQYLQSEKMKTVTKDWDESRESPEASDCQAVVLQMNGGALAFEKGTAPGVPGINLFEVVFSFLDRENEPIYLFTETSAYQVTALTFLERYKDIFLKSASGEKEEGKKEEKE